MATRLSGMISGMDTDSLISELVNVRKAKVTKTQKEQMSIKYKQDAWKDLNKKVKGLFSTLGNMRFSSNYMKRTTEVSNSNVASVVTADNAMLSTQTLKVNSLSKAGYMTGAELETVSGDKATSGTLLKDIKGLNFDSDGKASFSVKIGSGASETIELKDDMTLGDLASALKDKGLSANFDSSTQRLFIGSTKAGSENDFSFSGDNSLLSALGIGTNGNKIKASNAEIELNGVKYTSDSNTFNINGLTITAKSVSSEEVTLNTTRDTSAMYDNIKKFIKQYSELMNELDKAYGAKVDSSYKPLTDEEKSAMSDYEIEKWEEKLKEGALSKDANVNDLSNALKDIMGRGFEIGGKTLRLVDFGIETAGYFDSADFEKNMLHIMGDADDEKYSGSTNKLKQLIESDPDKVTSFFSSLSKSLYEKMDSMQRRVDGTRSTGSFYDDVSVKKNYDDYTTKLSNLEKQLQDYEDKWYKKFAKMETAMAKLQSKSSALTGYLGN